MENLESIAAQYLKAKREEKACKTKADGLKKQLDARLQDGDEVWINSDLFRWTISLGRSPSYKKVLDWLKEVGTPDLVVLVEEGEHKFTGTRVTKELKPAD